MLTVQSQNCLVIKEIPHMKNPLGDNLHYINQKSSFA